ncbi:hypothetical protein [Nucisporomicrobium flavum]|uniref:hypothetical protein n=1 Tax=Nucisporomicrobium flavum TaxID=2785915 RepID=UPI0018F3F9AC|nr:hypothetical protein [Nucisporomicrobium flavum]
MAQPDIGTLTVPDHIWGFPGVAHGGYVAGRLAELADTEDLRLDLRRPIPVGQPLSIERSGPDSWTLSGDGGPLAAARIVAPGIAVPALPGWDEGLAGIEQRRTAERAGNAFPDCWVCGSGRPAGQGLHVLLGLVPGRAVVAAAWTPGPEAGDPGEELSLASVFAVLDCPGGWACRAFAGAPIAETVTAFQTSRRLRPVRAGEPYVVSGWSVAAEGRKYRTGSAISTPDGELCAIAESLWLDVRRGAG